MQSLPVDQFAQQPPGPDEVRLTDHLGEGPGAHPFRQRRRLLAALLFGGSEQPGRIGTRRTFGHDR
ncbi:hypothetical protein L6Q96_22085 [Candidatus Binatia bacterium]|nr:hypothetical protein [Candidatus Binatia bacterium]